MRIPAKTLEAMAAEHPDGTRHSAKLLIALPLIGNGLPPEAVFATLRAKFPQATEREIRGVVAWCVSRNPTPSGYGDATFKPVNGNGHKPRVVEPRAVFRDAVVEESDWTERSPVWIPEDHVEHAALVVSTLYHPDEFLCGYTKFGKKPDGRLFPDGAGTTRRASEWLDRFKSKGVWQSEAGLWWRLNPLAQSGSGRNGAHTDADVTAFRFYLLEHDKLPLPEQLSLLAAFKLPLSCIVLTGGKSAHGWVYVNASDAASYTATVDRIIESTGPLGFDTNKNPSRLGRLPGAIRKIGHNGDGVQRLIYLNPTPGTLDLSAFEAVAQPIQGLVTGVELGPRVREYMRPKPEPFTFEFLSGRGSEKGFYFRDSELTVWSGVSGHGKTTLLTQLMVELTACEIPFFVCSLEHKAEGVCVAMARVIEHKEPSADEAEGYLLKFGSRFTFADTVGEIEIGPLFELMEGAHKRFGARHFFIDSLMRVAGLEEDYPAQTAFMNQLQAFAKRVFGHIHLVAHPRKIDELVRARKQDVKGSNNIINNPDNIVTMRRNVQKEDLISNGDHLKASKLHDAEFAVEKQRHGEGWQGVIKLVFDRASRTYALFVPPGETSQHAPRHNSE